MAVPSQHQNEDAPLEAGDSAFLEQAYLTYIIPFGTDVDIKDELQNVISKQQPLEDIESRSWLFFGKAPVWPCCRCCVAGFPEVFVSHNTYS